jgi:hypothetical protein
MYGNPASGASTDSGIGGGLLVVAIAVIICVLTISVAYIHHESSHDDSDVYEDLDAYGGTVYLEEATGSGAMSLVSWYVPKESDMKVTGDYIHVDKAKSYA